MSTASAERYARAIHSLAVEQKEVDAVHAALTAFANSWKESKELRQVFSSPVYSHLQRVQLLEATLNAMQAPKTVVNALKLLSERKRLDDILQIVEDFADLRQEAEGVVRAEVSSAMPLSDAYCKELTEVLEAVTGKKVSVVQRQDPSLMAGVVAKVGGQIFDGSLKHRLEEMRKVLGQNEA